MITQRNNRTATLGEHQHAMPYTRRDAATLQTPDKLSPQRTFLNKSNDIHDKELSIGGRRRNAIAIDETTPTATEYRRE